MSANGSKEFDEPAERPRTETEPWSQQSADASLWEKVLRQSTEGDVGCASLSAAERAALHDVARKYRGQPLTLEPIAAALVEAVLAPHLSRDPRMAEFRQVAYLFIAQTQMDDPHSRNLLQRFWSRLQGEQLIDQGQGLVRSLATKIHRKLPQAVDVEDLIGYGQVGLVEAARDFDPSRGNQFSTYAYYRIRGAIYDGLSRMSWFGRTHYEHVRYERMANEALSASAENKPAEAAQEETGAGSFRDTIWSLLVVYLTSHMQAGEEGDGDQINLADRSTPTPLSEAVNSEVSQQLRRLIDALPADEAALIRATYFEGATLEEAGRKIGISKSWASRLHAKSLERLARSLRLADFGS